MEPRPASRHCDRTLSMSRAYSSQNRNRSKTQDFAKTDFVINIDEVRRPQTTGSSSAFRDSISRFDQYASLRFGFSRQELRNSSLLGPGTYDISPISKPNAKRSAGGKANGGMTATNLYQAHSIFPVQQAPPVGTYNLPQIMDATNYGSMGIQVTSPFKSSGRSKQLLGDAQRFQTIAYEGSNIGPGSYDAGASYIGRISVSPTANDRVFRANRAKDKEDAAFRETLKTLSRSHICSADRCSTPNSTSDSSKLTKMTKLSTIESWEDGPLTPLPNSSKPCIGVSKKKASPTGESSVGSTRTSKSYQLHLLNCRKAEIMEVERLPSYE